MRVSLLEDVFTLRLLDHDDYKNMTLETLMTYALRSEYVDTVIKSDEFLSNSDLEANGKFEEKLEYH